MYKKKLRSIEITELDKRLLLFQWFKIVITKNLKMKIILIAKKNKPNVTKVISHLKNHCSKFYFFDSENINFKFSKIMKIKPDYLISYISDIIIPAKILKRTRIYNINFHPGPPNYPGIGCFNFAIYNEEKNYGCTVHLMEPSVDTGQIINVKNNK